MTGEEKLIYVFVFFGVIIWLLFIRSCINEMIHSEELKVQSEKNKINPLYFEKAVNEARGYAPAPSTWSKTDQE